MMVDLNQKEIDSLLGFCRNRAVHSGSYEEVSRFVKLVDKLTGSEPQKEEVETKVMVDKFTDVPLTYHYNTQCKREYRIDRLYSREGHLICKGRPLKLTIPQILRLKEILEEGNVVLDTQKDWIRLAKTFGITWMALQRYCYNIDIGTFDKWIQKFLEKHNCQTTLDKGEE